MLRYHASHPDAFDHTPSPQELPGGTKKKIEYRVHVRGTLHSYLMDADVLLLRLDHPDPLFPHFVHDTEDIYHVKFPDSLKDPVNGDHCS